jgi:hypothetical protein
MAAFLLRMTMRGSGIDVMLSIIEMAELGFMREDVNDGMEIEI